MGCYSFTWIYLELMSGWMLPRIGRDGYTQGCDDMLIDSLDCCYLVPTHELHIEWIMCTYMVV